MKCSKYLFLFSGYAQNSISLHYQTNPFTLHGLLSLLQKLLNISWFSKGSCSFRRSCIIFDTSGKLLLLKFISCLYRHSNCPSFWKSFSVFTLFVLLKVLIIFPDFEWVMLSSKVCDNYFFYSKTLLVFLSVLNIFAWFLASQTKLLKLLKIIPYD